jgi:SAM-dependent methyltransferase
LSSKDSEDILRQGHYAAKQIFCKDRLIAWSHRSRFEMGLRLARRFAGKRLLDYGSGDGTFLAMLDASRTPPASALGVEIDLAQVNDCKRRFADRPRLRFALVGELADETHRGVYDAVVCMEVLEHVVALDSILERLWRALNDSGTLIVSVPVETGLPLLLKQAARRIAGWRGIGDYPGTSPYSAHEYVASVFAGRHQHLKRPIYGIDSPVPFHDHKGFNWMALRRRLQERFVLVEQYASPMSWVGPHLGTQVWFVMHKRTV